MQPKFSQNAFEMQSKFRQNAAIKSQNSAKIQSKCSPNAVKNAVKMQSKCSQNAVKMRSKFSQKCSQNAVKIQSKCSQKSVSSCSAYRLKSFPSCFL